MSKSSNSSSSSSNNTPCHSFIESPLNISYFIACLTSGFRNTEEESSTTTTSVVPQTNNTLTTPTTIRSSVSNTSTNIPCLSQLQLYEVCVETHNGVAPRPYESEWCEEEKQIYLLCRQNIKQTKNHQ